MVINTRLTLLLIIFNVGSLYSNSHETHYRTAQKFIHYTFEQHQDKEIKNIITELKKGNKYFENREDTLTTIIKGFIEKHDLMTVQAKALMKFFSEDELRLLVEMEERKQDKKVFSRKHRRTKGKYTRLKKRLLGHLLRYLNRKLAGKL